MKIHLGYDHNLEIPIGHIIREIRNIFSKYSETQKNCLLFSSIFFKKLYGKNYGRIVRHAHCFVEMSTKLANILNIQLKKFKF